MAARAMSSTSSSGRGKCSRLGVRHLEKRNAARMAMWMTMTIANSTASQNNTLQACKAFSLMGRQAGWEGQSQHRKGDMR